VSQETGNPEILDVVEENLNRTRRASDERRKSEIKRKKLNGSKGVRVKKKHMVSGALGHGSPKSKTQTVVREKL